MNIRIGVLLPKSDMFPVLAKDVLNGLKLAINSELHSRFEPKYLIESIGNATDISLLERIERMLLSDETDIIVCFCSNFMLDNLIRIANSYQSPIIHITLGARAIKAKHLSPYVLHLSLNLCQTSYVSGMYAAKHFGKTGALLSSFYDGGYQLSESFFQGFTNNGGEIIYNYVSPMDYKNESFEGMINALEASNPAVIFTIFSYKEGYKVMQRLAKSNFNAFPIVAIPIMTDESQDALSDTLTNCYSIASWTMLDESEEMQHFISQYQYQYGYTPNIFGLIGFEIGLILNICYSNEQKVPTQIGDYFSKKTFITPRGVMRISKYNETIPMYFKLRKLEMSNGKFNNVNVAVLSASISDVVYEMMETIPYTGWKNPYLCT